MKTNVKSDYACRAILALALHFPNPEPLCIEEIARRQSIPANYLVQILLELKRTGLIRSHRGKAGGYLLARVPRDITFGDVLRSVQGEVIDLPGAASNCPDEIKHAWGIVQAAAGQAADSITLEDICASTRAATPMYHI